MKVRVGKLYRYEPTFWDLNFPCAGNSLQAGQVVRVIDLPGAPPTNTMGQCYVGDAETGKFICMISTASLVPVKKGRCA